MPSKVFHGPATPTGVVPTYSANGTQFYLVSVALYSALLYAQPDFAVWVYDDFSAIMSVLSLSALVLCCFLVFKGQ